MEDFKNIKINGVGKRVRFKKGIDGCNKCGHVLVPQGFSIKPIPIPCEDHVVGTQCVPESVGAQGEAGPMCDKGEVGKEFR